MKPLQSEVVTEHSKLSNTTKDKHIAKPYRLKRYYTATDVAVHNTANDVWVSFFNEVFDLTKLLQENHECEYYVFTLPYIIAPLIDPIVKNAGKDISWWFDPVTRDPKTCIDPNAGLKAFYLPMGRYLHVPSADPTVQDQQADFSIP
jgi:hypothetical protein